MFFSYIRASWLIIDKFHFRELFFILNRMHLFNCIMNGFLNPLLMTPAIGLNYRGYWRTVYISILFENIVYNTILIQKKKHTFSSTP